MATIRQTIRRMAQALGREELLRSISARLRNAVRLLKPAYPLHRSGSIEPFFIVGSGRCGTTLLRRLLQASPEVHIPPENWSMGGHIATFRRYRGILAWNALVNLHLGRHVMESHRWFQEPPTALRDRLLGFSEEKQSLAGLLDAIYCYHGECQEATFTRWGDKTPMNVGCMNGILDVFPEARFIHLLRDGVDVVHSWSGVEKYTGEVVRPARRWVHAIEAVREFRERHPQRMLEVRYENLCRKPEDELRRICEFIDLPYDEAFVSRTEHYDEMNEAQSVAHYEKAFESISTDSIGKGRESMGPEQKREIAPLLDQELSRQGYSTVQV